MVSSVTVTTVLESQCVMGGIMQDSTINKTVISKVHDLIANSTENIYESLKARL